GVYAGRAWTGGAARGAAINVGSNPTFAEHALKVEAHILDEDLALYGEPLELEFLGKLRDVTSFRSKEELVSQLRQDVAQIREMLARETTTDSARPERS
ncbi:MAG: bifunctional riboflavin kinase/FAD synthetase, partial [Planctomycetota bacterium]